MLRIFALTIGLTISAMAAPQSAYACSCLYISDNEDRFESYYKSADLIFQGVPTEVNFEEDRRIHYRISAEKVWKGHASARMDVATALDEAACGIDLDLDKRVIVFANEHEGQFSTGLCSGTVAVDGADEMIDWLNTYEEDTSNDDEPVLPKNPIDPEVDCTPYICRNGDIHPRCDGDNVINYLVDPCAFSDGETSEEEENDDGDAPRDGFADVTDSHPNFAAITFVRKEGIVSGYETGMYLPGNFINRAEFTKIIIEANFSRSAIDNCNEDLPFSDVSKDDWFFEYICMAVKHGILDGYPDSTFKPGNLVNFAEASKIVINAFAIRIDSGYEGGVWWRQYVLTLAGIGGLPSTFTDPNQSLTRGDMAEIIYRVMMGMT